MTCLDAAQEQILQLDSQVQAQKLLQNENQEAWSLIQGVYNQQLKCKTCHSFNVEILSPILFQCAEPTVSNPLSGSLPIETLW